MQFVNLNIKDDNELKDRVQSMVYRLRSLQLAKERHEAFPELVLVRDPS